MEQYSVPNLNIEENLEGAIPPRDLLNNFSIFKNCEETGKGVKICLVGTGKPLVDGVIIQTSVNMGNSQGMGDTHGASSVSSYIIKELAKNSSIFVSKMCDEHGGYSDATIVSSILWGISIGCDIILICCHIDMSNDIVKLAIEKCFDMNKIVVCNSISGKIPKNVINAKEIDIKYTDKIVVTGLNKSPDPFQ